MKKNPFEKSYEKNLENPMKKNPLKKNPLKRSHEKNPWKNPMKKIP